MRIVERTVLAVLLAATLATLLLVARNGLAPVQHPVSFGLVLWAWVLLFYSAVGLAALALAGLVSKLPRLARLPGWLLLVATLLFTAVALASNPRALSSVVALGGPGLFRLLLPVSAALCALALVAVGAPLARGAGWIRIVALIALVSGLLSLLPVGGAGNARAGASLPHVSRACASLSSGWTARTGGSWSRSWPAGSCRTSRPSGIAARGARSKPCARRCRPQSGRAS
jgi:hypothetical protein